MGSKFFEKIAPFYFLVSTLGCVSILGTLFGLIVFVSKGKQLQHGTRTMYLVMAFWTIAINMLIYIALYLVGGDPTTAAEVEAM